MLACNPRIQGVKEEGSVQSYPWLHKYFEATLDYMKTWFQTKQINNVYMRNIYAKK